MGNIFSGSEVVEIGIQIEKNGRDYYTTLMNQSKNEKARELFKFLAGEEEKHIVTFQKILLGVQKYEPQGLDSDEYYAYMNDLASEHVFTQEGKGIDVARAIKSDREAIDKAIGFEEDSIVFYEGVKKIVPPYDVKVVESLIAQEQNHLKQLIELKHKM